MSPFVLIKVDISTILGIIVGLTHGTLILFLKTFLSCGVVAVSPVQDLLTSKIMMSERVGVLAAVHAQADISEQVAGIKRLLSMIEGKLCKPTTSAESNAYASASTPIQRHNFNYVGIFPVSESTERKSWWSRVKSFTRKVINLKLKFIGCFPGCC